MHVSNICPLPAKDRREHAATCRRTDFKLLFSINLRIFGLGIKSPTAYLTSTEIYMSAVGGYVPYVGGRDTRNITIRIEQN